MTLNDVILDDGSMAGTKSLWNAEFIFDRIELNIRDLVRCNTITIFSQVTHPRDAATSGRVFIYCDHRPSNHYRRKEKQSRKR